jgi:[ribosomal protein S18]-alanine N-acetyltransferase
MMKTLIRHTADSDFPRLLQIDQDSFPTDVAYDSAELFYFMNRAGAETIVLESTGTIVAFLIMEVHRNRRMANIVTLDVDKDHRRLGHATQLLKRSEEILVEYGVEIYDLQVDVTNSGAIRFYKRHGFETVRVLRKYYANGNDAYLMVKELAKDD